MTHPLQNCCSTKTNGGLLIVIKILQETYSMDDDSVDYGGSQRVPSSALDDVVPHETSIIQPIVYDRTSMFLIQEKSNQHAHTVPIPMQCSVKEDIIYEKGNNQLLKRECPTEMTEIHDEQRLLRRARCSTASTGSNDDQAQKLPVDIIDQQAIDSPDAHVGLSNLWHLYRINTLKYNDLGFIVPYKLSKIPIFDLYENEDVLTTQLVYIGPIDYKEYDYQLKDFYQYIFKETFHGINTGLGASFELLPCVLKQTGQLDYRRMTSICNRNNILIQNSSELNDQEVYDFSNSSQKQFPMDMRATWLQNSAFDPGKRFLPVTKQRTVNSSINCFKKLSPKRIKELNGPSVNLNHSSHEVPNYAAVTRIDYEFIDKLPRIFGSIIEQLRKFSADNIQSHMLSDVDQMPMVTSNDALPITASPNQSTGLLLISLNYDLLSNINYEHHQSFDLLVQQSIQQLRAKSSDIKKLATLGDSFLKLFTSMALYHRYPSDDAAKKLKSERDNEVSNENLYRLAMKTNLKADSPVNCFSCDYKTNRKTSAKFIKEFDRKPVADMVEALIGYFLVFQDYQTTIIFMKWLGLDVIPIEDNDGTIKVPSILRENKINDWNEIEDTILKNYNKHSFMDVETKVNYHFKNKAYLIAAFTHRSRSFGAITMCYDRLKFLGNGLIEFLLTRHMFVTLKSPTSGHITDVRRHLLRKTSKAAVLFASGLYTKIICIIPKLDNFIKLNTTNKDFSIDESNFNQFAYSEVVTVMADVFEALVGAIFIDSGYSLKIAWDVIDLLLKHYINLDYSISHPNLKSERLIDEYDGKIIAEFKDANNNFICIVKFSDESIFTAYGKSKELAEERASEIIQITRNIFS